MWQWKNNIDHEWRSIELHQNFARLLVQQSRTNKNTFGGYEAEAKEDVLNYPVIFIESVGPVYVFK